MRVGGALPKQLLVLGGTTVLDRAIAAFDGAPEIHEILVLMAPGHLDAAREVVRDGGYGKVSRVIEGGATRSASTVRALEALGPEDCHVLFHDAARPLVSARLVSGVVQALQTHDAVTTAIPSADTVIAVDRTGETMTETLPRDRLRRVQTPQGFRLPVIREAYARAVADPAFVATDDASVVLRYLPHVPVAVVPGEERNLKITGPGDLAIAERLLELRG